MVREDVRREDGMGEGFKEKEVGSGGRKGSGDSRKGLSQAGAVASAKLPSVAL